MSDKIWYRVQHAKSGTVEKMARAWDDGDKEADQAEVLEAPAASEEDSAADRVEVSEVPAVSAAQTLAADAPASVWKADSRSVCLFLSEAHPK